MGLFSWLSRRHANRAIFRYWNGQQDVAADPLELLRGVESDTEFNLEIDPALVDAGDPAASLRMVNCVRRAFKVKPFAEGGLLEAECAELFVGLYEFLDSLKKSTDQPLTSPPPTASESSDPDHTPTNCSSDLPKTPSAAN